MAISLPSSVCQSLSFLASVFINFFVSLSILTCLSVIQSITPFCLCVVMSLFSTLFLLFTKSSLFIKVNVCLPVRLSIRLSVCLSVCLSHSPYLPPLSHSLVQPNMEHVFTNWKPIAVCPRRMIIHSKLCLIRYWTWKIASHIEHTRIKI